MSLSGLKRRIGALEIKNRMGTMSLTATEIEDILLRLESEEPLNRAEIMRIEHHGRIVGHNMTVVVHKNCLVVKRLLGLDLEIV
jgi:hypothetical protein